MMDAANFEMAKKNAGDHAIVETQLTTDGERYYGFGGRGGGAGNQDQQQDNTRTSGQGRAPAAAARSRARPTRSSAPRTQRRRRLLVAGQQEVLGVSAPISARSRISGSSTRWRIRGRRSRPTSTRCPARRTSRRPSCTWSTSPRRRRPKLSTDAFKDQQMGARHRADDEPAAREGRDRRRAGSRPGSDKIYFNRTSRDLKRIDIVVGRHDHRRAEGRRRRALEHLHRDPADCGSSTAASS